MSCVSFTDLENNAVYFFYVSSKGRVTLGGMRVEDGDIGSKFKEIWQMTEEEIANAKRRYEKQARALGRRI